MISTRHDLCILLGQTRNRTQRLAAASSKCAVDDWKSMMYLIMLICPPKFCVAVASGIENNAYAQFLGVSKDVQVAYSLDHLL